MISIKDELELYKTWYRAKHNDIEDIIGIQHKKLERIKKICEENRCIDNNGYCPQTTEILKIIGE